jgi:phage-related protein
VTSKTHNVTFINEAELDIETAVTVEGTVTEFSWRNPHTYFGVATTGERGEAVEWLVQTSPIISATRRFLRR